MCATDGVHTLTCCTHMFLRTARSLRTSHISHACHTHAWLEVMKRYVACVCLCLTFSLLIFHLFLQGHFETNLTDALIHTILPNFPDPKARVKRTLHMNEQVWLSGQVRPQHRSEAYVERIAALGDTRVQRRMFVIICGLDDAGCSDTGQESRTVRFLFVVFHCRFARRSVVSDHRHVVLLSEQ